MLQLSSGTPKVPLLIVRGLLSFSIKNEPVGPISALARGQADDLLCLTLWKP